MSSWRTVHARLVELLPTLPGWSGVPVFDGPPVTGEVPQAYCTVGFAFEEDSAGSFEHERAGNGFQLEETGGVRCELVATVGETDLARVRALAFDLLDEVEKTIRADQTLGVLPPASTTNLAVDVVPAQTTTGAQQRLPFTVGYFTRS